MVAAHLLWPRCQSSVWPARVHAPLKHAAACSCHQHFGPAHPRLQAWWGDSLTSTVLFYPDALKAWDDHFGFAKNWTAGVLGVGASDVEELFWRMAVGGEKFKNDPLVALLLIGLNNSPTDPRLGYKLDTLLRWIAYRMPKTKVLALAVWPTAKKTSGALLNVFRPILQRRGIEMSLCGALRLGVWMRWRQGKDQLATKLCPSHTQGNKLFFSSIQLTAQCTWTTRSISPAEATPSCLIVCYRG